MRNKLSFHPFFFTWLASWVFWLVLTQNTGWRELLVGAVSSAITLAAVASFVYVTRAKYEIRGRFLLEAMHVPVVLVKDLWVVLNATTRKLVGLSVPSGIAVVPFRPGADGPVSRARRAFVATYLTLTPNNVVFGVLREKNLFFFHTIIPRPLPPFVVRLGAEPKSES